MTELESHPVAGIFPMMSSLEFAGLVDDIKANGLREPVWLHRDGRILDGRNRWKACRELGIDAPARTYEGGNDGLVAFVVSLNLHRRHLNESQRAMVAARIANLPHGGAVYALSDPPIGGSLSQPQAAELLNVGERSVQRAQRVQDHAAPELAGAVDSGDVAVSTAATIADAPIETQQDLVRALDTEDEVARRRAEKDLLQAAAGIKARKREQRIAEKAAAVAEIAARPALPLTNLGPFPVLYADPPWRYDFAEDTTRQIENQYPTMNLAEIKALGVPAADDSVLFLWATSPKLPEALDVLDAWGFQYVTCMVWVKDKIGMGYYARQQHELLLIGKRGALPVPDPEDRPSSVIEAPRSDHSAKPAEAYELIERMYPLRDKCELFQRSPRSGWSGWGNQAQAG